MSECDQLLDKLLDRIRQIRNDNQDYYWSQMSVVCGDRILFWHLESRRLENFPTVAGSRVALRTDDDLVDELRLLYSQSVVIQLTLLIGPDGVAWFRKGSTPTFRKAG